MKDQQQQTEVRLEELTDDFQLGVYLMDLRVRYPEVTNYEDQVQLLEQEHGIRVTPQILLMRDQPDFYSQPTVEMIEEDYKLIYKHAGIEL